MVQRLKAPLQFLMYFCLSILGCVVLSLPGTAQLPTSAQTLLEQGKQFYRAGEVSPALDHWEQAARAYQQAQDWQGLAESRLYQAEAWKQLGSFQRSCRVLTEMLGTAEDICTVSVQPTGPILSSLQGLPQWEVKGLQQLGDVLRLIGNLNQSQAVLQQSWALTQQFNLTQEQGDILLSLGNLARDFGSRDRDRQGELVAPERSESQVSCLLPTANKVAAVTYYQVAIACYQQIHPANSAAAATPLYAALNHLSLLAETWNWLQAPGLDRNTQEHVWLQQWLSTTKMTPLIQTIRKQFAVMAQANIDATDAQLNFAHSLIQLKRLALLPEIDWADIQRLLTQIQQDSEQTHRQRTRAAALGTLGWMYEQQQQFQLALGPTEQAIQLAQSVRDQEGIYRWHWQRGRLLRQMGRTQEAIAAYDQSIQALDSMRSDLQATNLDTQFSFRDQVEPVYRELVSLLLPVQIQPDLNTLEKALNVINSLQVAELEYFTRCRLERVKSVQVEQLIDPESAVLYSITLPDRTEILLHLPHRKTVLRQTWAIGQAQLEQKLERFRRDVQATGRGNQYQGLAQEFYRQIVEPFEPMLQATAIKTLVIVPDASFRNVPFAALHRRQTQQHLIERYALAMTPSLEVLGLRTPTPKPLNALVAGLSIQPELANYPAFEKLEHVLTEVERIQAALPNSQPLLDKEFTVENFRDRVKRSTYPIIHIASHGQFNSSPEETFIVAASPTPIYAPTLQSILRERNQGEPIELLTLSACETADGNRRASLGLVGMAVQTGAFSTLGSLWAVEDLSTVMLMDQFYQQLHQSSGVTRKATSLQQAQQALLADFQYSHPYYWAPFILVGNWL